ncbi:MAG TPA: hypothetical protein VF453_08360 [Burkholderiaceae bacterium]
MGDLLKHPASDGPRVENIRAPGRKKGTVSLRTERFKRCAAAQPPAEPTPDEVRLPPIEAGKFFYPKSMLTQAYFCRGGTGIWSSPSMSLGMLVNERFVSPMGALLEQLEAEGHNVAGARAEWLAFRELAKGLKGDFDALSQQVMRIQMRRPLATAMLLEDGSK